MPRYSRCLCMRILVARTAPQAAFPEAGSRSLVITDVSQYAHLSDVDLAALAAELDEIRTDVEASRGARDRAYITRAIAFQRWFDIAARLIIAGTKGKIGWALGTTALAAAKCIENMELGHNITHGQWDWMNDPEIHSKTWEWDMAGLTSQWRYTHNYQHHVFTNIVGVDADLGFGVLRVTRDQKWRPLALLQPLFAVLLGMAFEWGIALYGVISVQQEETTDAGRTAQKSAMLPEMASHDGQDYVLFSALSGRRWRRTLGANIVANGLRSGWAYIVIVCGHFVDGAEKFTPSVRENETKPEWYLRQMLGTANFDAGPTLGFMTGNLCYQIEHHLYPDLPHNRYPEIAERVRAVCATYELPYTTGPLLRQYLLTVRTICKLALPDRWLSATSHDAPEAAPDHRFRAATELSPLSRGAHDVPRRGLVTAVRARSGRRQFGEDAP